MMATNKTEKLQMIVMFTAPALKWYVTSNTHNPCSHDFLPISHNFSQL